MMMDLTWLQTVSRSREPRLELPTYQLKDGKLDAANLARGMLLMHMPHFWIRTEHIFWTENSIFGSVNIINFLYTTLHQISLIT